MKDDEEEKGGGGVGALLVPTCNGQALHKRGACGDQPLIMDSSMAPLQSVLRPRRMKMPRGLIGHHRGCGFDH